MHACTLRTEVMHNEVTNKFVTFVSGPGIGFFLFLIL